jgi:hypothetical protein
MSLDVTTIRNTNTEKLGFFRFKRFDNDSYLITNDIGKFHFFSLDDFQKFVSVDVESLKDYDELCRK